MSAYEDLLKLLKENKDPRRIEDIRRVWPELLDKLQALIPENQGSQVGGPPKLDPNKYKPEMLEEVLQPKKMIGNISFFANHNDPSTAGRKMAITLESADHPNDQWFCAMRFEYVDWQIQSNGWYKPVNYNEIDQAERIEFKKYLKDRRLKITFNDKSVVVRPADVGPGVPKRIVDVSETAIKSLGAKTDDIVIVEWVNPETPLGPA